MSQAEHRLCVYGTLAPGRSNHREVAHLGGTWSEITVTGRVAKRRYPVFTFDPEGAPQPMLLLEATALATAWPQLDRFEGREYRRIAVPATRQDGSTVEAFVYEAVRPVDPAS